MTPLTTRTGAFRVGLRQGRGDWQRDVSGLSAWAATAGFQSVDLTGRAMATDARAVAAAGLAVGTVDLLHMGDLTAADPGKRREVIAANLAHVADVVGWGVRTLFSIVGGEANRTRAENYRVAVDSFAPLAEAAAAAGATIAVEGYPGHPPHHALLCTTPETCRAFLADLPRGVSLNFDPSHLIRLGVDHVRFLREFGRRIAHVHAKDTELFPEAAYELGTLQPSAFRDARPFGGHTWRYCVPGHGVGRWAEVFRTLDTVGYTGRVSVELEDEHFNGTPAGEQAGLRHAAAFLGGV